MPIITSQSSNYQQIQQAIVQVATTGQNSISFGQSTSQYEVPTPDDLDKTDANGLPIISYPYFAVRQGRLVGFATGVGLNTGAPDEGMRGMQIIEPVWDFDCYVFYPYSTTQPNYDLVANAIVVMTLAFINNYTLNGTCVLSNPHSFNLPYAEIGTKELVAAKWTLRVYEQLNVNYS